MQKHIITTIQQEKAEEKIDRALANPDKSKNYYSYEYFPAKTPQGVENLLDRIERMSKALKDALDDLAKCRGQLMQCKALATAKRLEHEFCNMTPGSMTLR